MASVINTLSMAFHSVKAYHLAFFDYTLKLGDYFSRTHGSWAVSPQTEGLLSVVFQICLMTSQSLVCMADLYRYKRSA